MMICYQRSASAEESIIFVFIQFSCVSAYLMIQNDFPTSLPETDTSGIRLFLDTADTKEWQNWLPTGLFYGVTTNPLLLERDKVNCTIEALASLAKEGFNLGAKEIQLQTWGTSVDSLVERGKKLAAIDNRIIVKVPITKIGTQAAFQLIAAGVKITLTGVYAVHQIAIAAALHADYTAPYLGRINDLGRNGREDIAAMGKIISSLGSTTRILVASIRSVDDIAFLASQGLNTFTLSPAIAAGFFDVAATIQAANDFQEAARKMGGE